MLLLTGFNGTNSGIPGAEGYNNTCYCPGNPALDPNLLNLTGALRRAQARNIFTAPGIRAVHCKKR
jgi:hypothetical protein